MNFPQKIAVRLAHLGLLLVVAALGTILLVRFAPGFFSDYREMDERYGKTLQSRIKAELDEQRSVRDITFREVKSWLRGDFGESRQYHIPVSILIRARLWVSFQILAQGLVFGWLIAVFTSVPISFLRKGKLLLGIPFTIVLSVPAAAMATTCFISDTGGPVLVLSLITAAREYKFLHSMLHGALKSPHLLHGRAQGLTLRSLLLMHVVPNAMPRLRALATLSIVTALGAFVPIEVIFNAPGVGQLAWSAVMNRDLSVLVAISLLMAAIIGIAGMLSSHDPELEAL